MKKESILGINVCVTTYHDIINNIEKDISNNSKSLILAINPEKIMNSRKDQKLKRILEESTYPIPDGIGVVYASKIHKGNITSRITGIDLMNALILEASKKEYKVFLYGSKSEVLERTISTIKEKYPNIKIVGSINGYEKNQDRIINLINKSKPDILFVALGSPKQEYFIYDNYVKLNCKIFMGVGGAFDILSGKTKRAPEWMRKKGLEWLYRLFCEPQRIIRQIKLVPFLLLIIFSRKKHN